MTYSIMQIRPLQKKFKSRSLPIKSHALGEGYLTREVTGCVANLSIPCTLSHKTTLARKNVAKSMHYPLFQENSEKNVLPQDTLSHNFLINCSTLLLKFHQKKTPCRIISTIKDTLLSGTSRLVKYGSTLLLGSHERKPRILFSCIFVPSSFQMRSSSHQEHFIGK